MPAPRTAYRATTLGLTPRFAFAPPNQPAGASTTSSSHPSETTGYTFTGASNSQKPSWTKILRLMKQRSRYVLLYKRRLVMQDQRFVARAKKASLSSTSSSASVSGAFWVRDGEKVGLTRWTADGDDDDDAIRGGQQRGRGGRGSREAFRGGGSFFTLLDFFSFKTLTDARGKKPTSLPLS